MGGAVSRSPPTPPTAAVAPPPPPSRPLPPPPTATPLGKNGGLCVFYSQGKRERGLILPPSSPTGNPLPPTLHATADPPGRVIIVGDVHGCIDELKDLLVKTQYDRSKGDCLIFVGDLVNKGPDSLAVLDAAIAHAALTVRGNHDEAAVAAHRGRAAPPPSMGWLRDGKKGAAGGKRVAAGVDYLAYTPFTLSLPSRGLLIVHAGLLPPAVPLASQTLEDFVELRFVAPTQGGGNAAAPSATRPPAYAALDKTLAKSMMRAGRPEVRLWADVYSDAAASAPLAHRTPVNATTLPPYPHIVFGHHASARLQASRSATGIDTGCVVGGELTALVLPRLVDAPRAPNLGGGYEALGGTLVSVQARRAYSGDA